MNICRHPLHLCRIRLCCHGIKYLRLADPDRFVVLRPRHDEQTFRFFHVPSDARFRRILALEFWQAIDQLLNVLCVGAHSSVVSPAMVGNRPSDENYLSPCPSASSTIASIFPYLLRRLRALFFDGVTSAGNRYLPIPVPDEQTRERLFTPWRRVWKTRQIPRRMRQFGAGMACSDRRGICGQDAMRGNSAVT